MKKFRGIPGKISDHFKGLGTVTKEMVASRAQELAIINGREQFIVDDWIQAKRELIGIESPYIDDEEEGVVALTRWDEEPGTAGHHVPNLEVFDEQTLAEHLCEEGIFEAEHEQMLEGSRPEKEDEI